MRKTFSVTGEITNKVFPRLTNPQTISNLLADDIAEVAYEAVSIFLTQQDGIPRDTWGELKVADRSAVIRAVHKLANDGVMAPAQRHERWVQNKRKAGWTYGPAKNAKKKKHPELLPYKNLPKAKRVSDGLFHTIVFYMLENHV